MNFLAHLFLSGNDTGLMIGNFIADFVKGKAKENYTPEIRKGIELHRAIDDFTDHHPVTSQSKHRLYPTQRKYAPVVVDMYYDHFLAKNFDKYSDVPLNQFAGNVYKLMNANREQLPEQVRGFLTFMIERNWLVNYGTIEGISRTLTGMSKRVAFPNNMNSAGQDLINSYAAFGREFDVFFPELLTFVASKR
jgi:acyl carrier protein phosphodiesterase